MIEGRGRDRWEGREEERKGGTEEGKERNEPLRKNPVGAHMFLIIKTKQPNCAEHYYRMKNTIAIMKNCVYATTMST
jgi:hypothetical protein